MSIARLAIIDALVDRLAEIQVDKGFKTDAGKNVFYGEKVTLGPDDPPFVLCLVVKDDNVGHQRENVCTVLPIEIQASVKPGADVPTIALESMVADIMKAVEIDHTLGGLARSPHGLVRGQTRVLGRETGHEHTGLGITYEVHFVEKWGVGVSA